MISDKLKIAYRILFTLQLELDGYSGDLNQLVSIVPDAATRDLFAWHQVLPRKQRGAYIALIEVVPEGIDQGRPEVGLKEQTLFRFQVRFDNALLSRCHLSSYDFLNSVLCVSNDVNHPVASQLMLTRQLPDYNSGDTYKKGYLVKSAGSYYKAIKESNAVTPRGVADIDYWKPLVNDGYISQADLRNRALLSEAADTDALIVIEIKHEAAIPAAYQLLDGAAKCREIKYMIKLLST